MTQMTPPTQADLQALAQQAMHDPEASALFEKITGSSAQQVAEQKTQLTPAKQEVLSQVSVERDSKGGYIVSSSLTRGRCATVSEFQAGRDGLLVIPLLRPDYMQGIDDEVIRAAAHNFKSLEIGTLKATPAPAVTPSPNPPSSPLKFMFLSLEEFRETARYVKDLSAHTHNPDEKDCRGFMYADGCYIAVTGFAGDHDAYTLTIGSDSRSSESREDLDRVLYTEWYIPECVDLEHIEDALRRVYAHYPEYHSKDYGSGEFHDMVEKFAKDDFYGLHAAAKAYQHHQNLAFDNYPDWGTEAKKDAPKAGVAYSPTTPPPMTMSDLGWPQSAPVLGFSTAGTPVMVIFEQKDDDAPENVTVRMTGSEGWDMTGKLQSWTLLPDMASLKLSPELEAKEADNGPSLG